MGRLLKSFRNGESGQTLAIVLCMLVLGSLVMVPLLDLSASSIQYHETVERNTVETYSAEAGVEYAITKLGNSPQTYLISPLNYSFTTNNKAVDVNMEYQGNDVFKITSTATTDADRSTTIEAYVQLAAPDFSYLPENAITCPGDVQLQPGTVVNGDVQFNGDLLGNPDQYEVNGEIKTDPIPWPLLNAAEQFYLDDVSTVLNDPTPEMIDVKFTPAIGPSGPFYHQGDFSIDNSQKSGAALTLQGTVFIDGNISFEQPGTSKEYLLDLNNQTVFATGRITFPSSRVTIFGNGCIIAVGPVDFQPSVSSAFGHFVFVMSIEDTVNFQPSGDFTGSIAGDVMVDLSPGSTITWSEPPWEELNIPQGDFNNGNYGGAKPTVLSWQIK